MGLHLNPDTFKLLAYQAAVEGKSIEEALEDAIRDWCSKNAYLRSGNGKRRFFYLIEDTSEPRCQR